MSTVRARRLWHAASIAVPFVATARGYQRSWVRYDVLAALSLWALLVPQALAYSELAGLPPVVGLYTALAAMVVYAVLGTTRCLTVGPESTIALIVAGALGPLAAGDPDRYVALASMLALLTGGLLFVGAAVRAGAVLRLLSAPVLLGYLAGAGIVIMVSQLTKELGFTVAGTYPTVVGGVVREIEQTNLIAVLIALATIAIVMVLRAAAPRIPGGLIAIAGATGFVWLADLSGDVAVVGDVEGGLPSPNLNVATLADITALLPTALSIALFVFASSALTAKALDRTGDDLDTDREFVALGAANVASGLFGGFAANSSDTRSFVLAQSGAKTQVANLISGGFVLVTLLWLTPLFQTLPTAALGGVIVLTAIKLVDVPGMGRLYRLRTMDFWLAAITLVGVLLTGPIAGIGVGVVASLLDTVRRTAMPRTSVLGRLPDDIGAWRDVDHHPEAATVPGVLVYRFDAPLFFANADVFRLEVLRLVDGSEPHVHTVIVNAEGMNDLDVTGAAALEKLTAELHKREVRLAFARVRAPVRHLLHTTGLIQNLGADALFFRVDDAVASAVGQLDMVAAVLGYSLAARRFERTNVTAAMVFVGIGTVIGSPVLGLVSIEPNAPWLLVAAEITLALLLFSDASGLRLRDVEGDPRPVARLLLIGFPLTLVAGTLLAYAVVPTHGWAAAALISALLAPTDAALGAAVVSDTRVPTRVRRLLNVESGLNDGLATPIVTVLIAVVASEAGGVGDENWVCESAAALSIAVLVAFAVGSGGGLLRYCRTREWTSPLSEQVAVLALALLCYLAATAVEGNGFVAAFVGGIVFAHTFGASAVRQELDFTETAGLLASYIVWVAFGAALVGPALSNATVGTLAIVVGALTLARMLPVAVAMVGHGWGRPTIAFVGWFGPRGLATVIFALIALESLGTTTVADHVLEVAALTVVLSVVAHGVSAAPLAARYGRWAATQPTDAPELVEVFPPQGRRTDLHSHRTS